MTQEPGLTPSSQGHHPLGHLEGAVERAFGEPHSWSAWRRFGLGMLALVAYLATAQLEGGLPALFLALGFYLVLDRWIIDGPHGPRIAEARLWAALTFLTSAATFAVWWWALGSEALQAWSTHVWLPMAIVSVALVLEGVRRPPAPAIVIGEALARARSRRHQGPDDRSPPGDS